MHSPFLRRRWLQFRLRTLLIITLAVALLMAWVVHKRDEARQQQKAFHVILDKGGASNFGPESTRPTWVRWILGSNVAAAGGCVEFGDSTFNDADLAQLSALGTIQRLSLSRTRVSDKGLVHLKKLTRLKYLSLDETSISDAGLISLHNCRSLEWLYLGGTRTTDAGVQNLQMAQPNLNVVDRVETEWPALSSSR